MVRAAAMRAAPSELVSAVRSTAHAREGANSAQGLPAASTPVNTPVVARRNSRRPATPTGSLIGAFVGSTFALPPSGYRQQCAPPARGFAIAPQRITPCTGSWTPRAKHFRRGAGQANLPCCNPTEAESGNSMGLLIDGEWRDEVPKEGGTGEFVRAASQFRDRITADGSSGFK